MRASSTICGTAFAGLTVLSAWAYGCSSDSRPAAVIEGSDASLHDSGGGHEAAANDAADGGDGGAPADSPSGDDAGEGGIEDGSQPSSPDAKGCTTKSDYGGSPIDDAGCFAGETYACAIDQYQIECDCPAATCTCTKNGSPAGTALYGAGCPACSGGTAFSSVAASCGIPY